MTAFYAFALVLGGGLLGLSLFGDLFGGHADVDLDADAAHVGGDAPDGHAASKIFSVRTVIYSLFGFGAVGSLLTWLWHGASPVATLSLAAVTGLTSGALINQAFGWVKRSESGAVEGEDRFSGHTGRVTLPIAASGGKVVVGSGGRDVELRALPHPSATGRGDPAAWRSVVVVEMERGVAFVAPVDEELLKP